MITGNKGPPSDVPEAGLREEGALDGGLLGGGVRGRRRGRRRRRRVAARHGGRRGLGPVALRGAAVELEVVLVDRVERAQRRVRRLGVLGARSPLREALLEGDDGLEVHFSVGAAAAARRGQPACFCLGCAGRAAGVGTRRRGQPARSLERSTRCVKP